MIPIEFCIRYGTQDADEQEALSLARRLFAVYDTGIDALSLVPAEEAGIALFFNGRLVASHQRNGHAPTVADVREMFRREAITVTRRPWPEEAADADGFALG